MISPAVLQTRVLNAVSLIKRQSTVNSVEAFAVHKEHLLCRLNYTSDIPCNGVEEPKSTSEFGMGLRVVFGQGDQQRIGFGSITGDLSNQGILLAFGKAKTGAVRDPHFKSLPSPLGKPTLTCYHDPTVMSLRDAALVASGWKALSGALEVFAKHQVRSGVIVGGDVRFIREHSAIASSLGIRGADAATACIATITAMSENDNAKGTGTSVSSFLRGFSPQTAGKEAAENVMLTRKGIVPSSGVYPVVLGPQAVADLVEYMLAPSLSLDEMDSASSPYTGKFGQQITSDILNVYDDGSRRGFLGSRGMTCEGIPTRRVNLVQAGKLVGVLASSYIANKVGGALCQIVPRNGYRMADDGGRSFDAMPTTAYSNFCLEGTSPKPRQHLLKGIRKGLYLGRIWYTYPMHGIGAGKFSSTVIGDSYMIENGKLGRPLAPNKLRIVDNFIDVFNNVLAAGNSPRSVLVWGSAGIIVTPELLVKKLRVERIGQ